MTFAPRTLLSLAKGTALAFGSNVQATVVGLVEGANGSSQFILSF